ncbi:hypothetical protein CCACVL1_07410, partial [Corchorus capsularis]
SQRLPKASSDELLFFDKKFFLFAATTEIGDLNPYEEARQKRIQENQK